MNTSFAALSIGLAALLAPCVAARANDSTAELAAGGLVLTKTADIEMRSEDLYVSAEEIRVTYRFFNRAAQDRTVTVAFPMPDVTLDFIDGMTAVPHPGTENFLDFSTKADGKPVATEVEVKAFGNGVDQTALLRRLGVPLYPDVDYDGLTGLPKAQRDELIALGLAAVNEFDSGQGWEQHVVPSWTLKTTYHFQQTFPAGREVVIEHRYTPATGSSVGSVIGSTYAAGSTEYAKDLRTYCVDQNLLAAVKRAQAKAGPDGMPFMEQRVAYILTTGANWAAPIKDFRLVVDKGDARNLVSFCGDGVKKISPTQFEVRKTDFTPDADLNVLILRPSLAR
ncbi:DUF4424 domain-containing protein [Inquilinus sp. Marseille-Q2685]|uniref:DUF4424 domain-containing protein n=1 Tax=Inquilinus sp. Marseille-Q2685 TaxID=2866581 RepID=UPI001CE41834|nr:DUF4424 domain-containing protein [Inquilinus sp. Marseille-Q2685]